MDQARNQESNQQQMSSKVGSNIIQYGLHAFSGEVEHAQMKITELELAHDGIYFWHHLSTSFGFKTTLKPYAPKEGNNQQKSDRSKSKSNSASSSTNNPKPQMPAQPSVDDHKQLFQILKLNSSSNPNNIFSINKRREELFEAAKKIKRDNEDELSNLCVRIKNYIENIIEYMDEFGKNLIPIRENMAFTTKISDNRGIDLQNIGQKQLKTKINKVFSDLCQQITFECEHRLLQSISANVSFFKDLFCEKSFLKDVLFTEKILNFLIEKYSQLSPDPNIAKNPNFQSDKFREPFRANVVTANLYIIYEHKGQSALYQSVEINHDDKSAFSRSSFPPDQTTKFDEHIKEHYEKPGKTTFLATCSERAIHDSEKALMMSLLESYLMNKEDIPAQNEEKDKEEEKENNQRSRVKKLADKLIVKLEKSGVKSEDEFTITEIGLHLFSIRQYCFWCESYLSHEFKELYKEINDTLIGYFENVSMPPKDSLKKYGSYSFMITNEQIVSNEKMKGEFTIDRVNMKSYFSKKFLIDTLTNLDKISEHRRSYFLNDPSSFNEEEKLQFIQKVSEKAQELNNKRKEDQIKTELIKKL